MPTLKSALRRTLKPLLSSLHPSDLHSQSHLAQQTLLSLPQYRTAQRLSIYLSMPTAEVSTDLIVREALQRDEGNKVFVPYIRSRPRSRSQVDADGNGKGKGRGKVMEMLQLRSVEEYKGLTRDGWGIPSLGAEGLGERENAGGGFGVSSSTSSSSPDKWSEVEGNSKALSTHDDTEGDDDGGLDLIVVPGMAFDEHMSRLGHGAGFYDEFISRFCQNPEEGGRQRRRKKPFLVGLCLAQQLLPPGQIKMEEWDWRMDAVVVGDGRVLTRAEH